MRLPSRRGSVVEPLAHALAQRRRPRRRRSRSARSRRSARRRAADARRADTARRTRTPTIAALGERARSQRSTDIENATGVLARPSTCRCRDARTASAPTGTIATRHARRRRGPRGRVNDCSSTSPSLRPGHDHHLAVELNAALGEPRELLDDVRHPRVVEQNLAALPTASREPRRTAATAGTRGCAAMSRSFMLESVAKLPYANERR